MNALPPNEFLPTRQSLLSRLRDLGDDQSWREFFDTYWKLIYSFATRKGLSPQEAQEVVQETCVAVARTMPQFRYDPEKCTFKSWLRHLAEKKIADQFRRRERGGPSVSVEDTEIRTLIEAAAALEREAPDVVWDEEWQKHLLEAAMTRVKGLVSPKQFKLFHHHAVAGHKAMATARTFQVSVMQVYLARHRVGKLVKQEVDRLRKKPV